MHCCCLSEMQLSVTPALWSVISAAVLRHWITTYSTYRSRAGWRRSTDGRVSKGAGHLWRTHSHRDADMMFATLCVKQTRGHFHSCCLLPAVTAKVQKSNGEKRFTVCFKILFYTCCSLSPCGVCVCVCVCVWVCVGVRVCVCVCGHTHWDTNAHTQSGFHTLSTEQQEKHHTHTDSHTENQHLLHKSSSSTQTAPQHSLTQSMSNSA